MLHAKMILCSILMLLTGCGIEADFSGHPSEQVWRAMQAVAEQPDYDHDDYTKRWTVVENIVHVDEDAHRIDIERQLERVLVRPRTRPLHQDEHWSFQVTLMQDNQVLFRSMSPAIPAHVQFEANRYFASVRRLLAGLPPPEHIRERLRNESDVEGGS